MATSAVTAKTPTSHPFLPLPAHTLQELFDRAPQPQLVILPDDPAFTIAAASDAYLQLTQTTRGNLLGKSVFAAFPDNPGNPMASGVRNLRASLQRVISTQAPDRLPVQRYDVERPAEKGGGFEERYWNSLNTPILGSDGKVAYIFHSVEEITELIVAERKAQRAMQDLKLLHPSAAYLAEQRLRQAERAGRVGSFEWFLKEQRAICSPELEALYGLPEGTFEEGFESWSKSVYQEDAQRVIFELESCMAQHLSECGYEFRVVLPNGHLRWLRGQAQLFYDAAGQPERMIGVNIDIDAEKQAQAHLRENEQRLRAIFDGTYEYIGLLAPDGTLLEANRASLEFANNKRDQVVGRRFWDTPWFSGTPGASEKVQNAIARAAAGEFVRFAATLRRPSGECPTFDISLHPIHNEKGEVVLIVPEGRNITEHEKSKERLQQQWQVFDTALSHTPDHIYIFDTQGRFTYANRALLSRWGKTLEEALGKNFFELGYPVDLAERVHRQIRQLVESKQAVRDHAVFAVASGEIRHFDYLFVPVIAADGSVEAVAGSTRDVTDRERMEKALADSEQNLQRVIAQAPVAIAVLRGRDFSVEMANSNLQELLPGRSIVGLPAAEVVPELSQDIWDAFHRVFNTGEPFIADEWHIRYDPTQIGQLQDHWFNVALNPLLDQSGVVSGIIAVITNVTASVLARKELERVNHELEEFSYVASHDLQEPLRIVNLYSQLLLKALPMEDPTINHYAGVVRQGVHRMERLLKDLLTFSRTVHSDAPVTGIADLTSSLALALSVLKTQIDDARASISAGLLPQVRGDTQQLSHVFQNVLSNALKYRKSEQPAEIQIWAEPHGTDWIISVKDNGIGFEPQYSERIFGLFKRLHRDEYPGTGLGLAICRRIVARYGGRIWAESKLGEGAVFKLCLPAQ